MPLWTSLGAFVLRIIKISGVKMFFSYGTGMESVCASGPLKDDRRQSGLVNWARGIQSETSSKRRILETENTTCFS